MEFSMEEELVCPICLSLFQEPQMLRCGHNFCLPCLDSCFPGGQHKSKCPVCRCRISRNKFTYNRVLANLAKKAYRLNKEPLPVASEVADICKEHNEPLTLCCKQDLVPICVVCQDLPQHQGHSFLPIKSARKYTKICNEEILSHISRAFDGFHQVLHEKEEDIKKTMEEKKSENLQEMEDGVHSQKEGSTSHAELNTKIETAFEMADYFAFLRNFRQLIERVKEFQIPKAKDDDVIREEEGKERDEEEVRDNEDPFEFRDNDFEEFAEDHWNREEAEDNDFGNGLMSEEEADSGDSNTEEEEDGNLEISEEGGREARRNTQRGGGGSRRWGCVRRLRWRWGHRRNGKKLRSESFLNGRGWRWRNGQRRRVMFS